MRFIDMFVLRKEDYDGVLVRLVEHEMTHIVP